MVPIMADPPCPALRSPSIPICLSRWFLNFRNTCHSRHKGDRPAVDKASPTRRPARPQERDGRRPAPRRSPGAKGPARTRSGEIHARTPPRAARQNRTTEEAAGIEDAPDQPPVATNAAAKDPRPKAPRRTAPARRRRGSNATDQPVTVDSPPTTPPPGDRRSLFGEGGGRQSTARASSSSP